MLHIRCGEDILAKLDLAGVPGRKLSWADPLCEGPWLPYERAFARPVRARFLAERYALDFMSSLDALATADEALEGAADEGEVVLWFEHDLFDQPILAWLLTQLAPFAERGVRVSLVQLGDHPSVERFVGLGQLDAPTLGALFPRREPVRAETFALAERAVQAWSAPDPAALEDLRRPDPALPHLAAAIERYLAEYPSAGDGLALSERMGLEAIADGVRTARAVFAHVQQREARPWMGDAMLFARLRVLSEGAAPLLRVDGAWPTLDDAVGDPGLSLTDTGRRVLAGEADWLAVQPQERWMGGVHLRPGGTDWRWDVASRRVVSRGAPARR
jgi:hypothetical protein